MSIFCIVSMASLSSILAISACVFLIYLLCTLTYLCLSISIQIIIYIYIGLPAFLCVYLSGYLPNLSTKSCCQPIPIEAYHPRLVTDVLPHPHPAWLDQRPLQLLLQELGIADHITCQKYEAYHMLALFARNTESKQINFKFKNVPGKHRISPRTYITKLPKEMKPWFRGSSYP